MSVLLTDSAKRRYVLWLIIKRYVAHLKKNAASSSSSAVPAAAAGGGVGGGAAPKPKRPNGVEVAKRVLELGEEGASYNSLRGTHHALLL